MSSHECYNDIKINKFRVIQMSQYLKFTFRLRKWLQMKVYNTEILIVHFDEWNYKNSFETILISIITKSHQFSNTNPYEVVCAKLKILIYI